MNRFRFPFDLAGGDEPGQVGPRQPTPIETRLARMRVAGAWVTVLVRKRLYGDSKRCRLCPRCTAVGGECILMIRAHITDQDAPLYQIGSVPHRDD